MYLITLYNKSVPSIVHGEFSRVAEAKITREKNAIGSLSFTIWPNNAGYDYLTEFATTVEAVDLTTGVTEFDGRVISVIPSMDSDGSVCKQVTCEDIMGYLCDSRQPYTDERIWEGDESRNGLQEYIDYLLANHNAHMPIEKRVYRGNVDVQTFATTENVTKGTNFERTFDVLKSKLVDVFGGEMRVRRGDDGMLYLDYCEKLGSVSDTPIRIGHNMLSAKREVKPDKLVTRLYPRGCKLSKVEVDESGNEREVETEERLGIADVNSGIEYIDDDEAVRIYGIIEGDHEWDDVTEPLILKTKAEAWIKDNNRLPVATTATGYDLSLIGIDASRFRVYDWYRCYNPLVGLDETLEIVRQTININDPSESSYELGESTTLQSQKIATLNGLKGEVEYVKSQNKTNAINIKNTIVYTMSAIEVAEDRIMLTVGEQIVETSERIEGQIEVVSSRVSTVEQTAESITLRVEELTEEQQGMKAQIEVMPDQITASVTKYVDGEIKTVNSAISEVVQTAESIKSTVSSLQAAYGTCTTAGATAAKTASAPNFTLFKGATISVKFSYKNTAENPTLNVNGTGAKAIHVNGSAMTSDYYWDAQDVLSFVYDGSVWRVADCGSISSISQLADSITLKVSKGDVSSQLSVESGAISIRSNRFSWESTYSNLTSDGKITCTSGTIGGFTITPTSISNDLVLMNSDGMFFTRGSTSIGNIGLHSNIADPSILGLTFALNKGSGYMSWAVQTEQGVNSYTPRLIYANTALPSGWEANMLHFACYTNFHNYSLKNAWIDTNTGGALQGRSEHIFVVGKNTTYELTFKAGMLIGLSSNA